MKFDVNRFMHGGLIQNALNVGLTQSQIDNGLGGYQDIRFEGLMCSAIADSDTGERAYFTVDPRTGNAISSFNEQLTNLQFSVADFEEKEINPIVEKIKPDVVKVVRYFRRYNCQLQQIESSGGLTVGVLMDYKQGLMQIFPTFCAPTENFSKEVGQHYVNESYANRMGIQFEFDKELTIRENLIDALDENRVTWLTNDLNAIKIMSRGFKNALRDQSDIIVGALEQ